MPNIFNKTTGERIKCEKEQVEAMLAGNYSLTKPDLDAEAKEDADAKAAEEKAASEAKVKEDAVKRATAAKAVTAKRDAAKLPGNK